MIDQHRYIMALSYQLAHRFILHYCCAASCRERPSFDCMLNRFWRVIFLPAATLSRADLLVFLPAHQPPLTGSRPSGGAPANEAFLHLFVHQRVPFQLSNAPLFEKHFFPPTPKPRPLSINFRAPFHLTNTNIAVYKKSSHLYSEYQE